MRLLKVIVSSLLSVSLLPSLLAQGEKENVTNVISGRDSLFWLAYNACNIQGMQRYFTDDVEFYHDKGGLTLGLENLVKSLKTGLCGNANVKLRREIVDESVKIYPLKDADTMYGAIITGEHVFYVLEGGKERLDGQAKFSHVWIVKDGDWRMSRILSYDHGPVPYVNRRKVVQLTDKILDTVAGHYQAPQAGLCIVRRENDVLHLVIGDQKYILYPQSDNIFFTKDRDLTFEFTDDKKTDALKMIVRENGRIVEEAVSKK